ncbi:MAG: RsmE family RNA methyltransferase, partial [Planctomycetota bacterium]|nr:RsmE family RNA methyltransferase [Planctomycetota bacterium]
VVGEVLQKQKAVGEPSVQITLFQSLLAREKFEWVLQKCTEVGVTRFVPVITQRALVRETAIKPEKLDRWQRIITEAAEQSHRGRIPDLLPPVSFEEILPNLRDFERCLIAREPAEGRFDPVQPDGVGSDQTGLRPVALREALRAGKQTVPGTVAVLVGPEGGFTEQEVQLAQSAGAVPVGLGPRILRTETAAIVATTLILHELGQMEG